MLATQLNTLIVEKKMEPNTLIRVNKLVVNRISGKANSGKDQKKIIILLDIDVVMPGHEVSYGVPKVLSLTNCFLFQGWGKDWQSSKFK